MKPKNYEHRKCIICGNDIFVRRDKKVMTCQRSCSDAMKAAKKANGGELPDPIALKAFVEARNNTWRFDEAEKQRRIRDHRADHPDAEPLVFAPYKTPLIQDAINLWEKGQHSVAEYYGLLEEA